MDIKLHLNYIKMDVFLAVFAIIPLVDLQSKPIHGATFMLNRHDDIRIVNPNEVPLKIYGQMGRLGLVNSGE